MDDSIAILTFGIFKNDHKIEDSLRVLTFGVFEEYLLPIPQSFGIVPQADIHVRGDAIIDISSRRIKDILVR